jgi:hypothetical protein
MSNPREQLMHAAREAAKNYMNGRDINTLPGNAAYLGFLAGFERGQEPRTLEIQMTYGHVHFAGILQREPHWTVWVNTKAVAETRVKLVAEKYVGLICVIAEMAGATWKRI